MREINNREFRRALLSLNGLAPPDGDDPLPSPAARKGPAWVEGTARRLGFVQVDTVSAIERAHHQILFSRNPRYRHDDLATCLEEDRTLFENFTHDAAVLPVGHFPYWRHTFARQKRYDVHPGYKRYFSPVTPSAIRLVLGRIRKQGPLKPRELDTAKVDLSWGDGFPKPTLAKVTMEFLWRTGRLAVARRDKREKVYDLVERVIPPEHLERRVSHREYVDWACREALSRLGAARPSHIARFFEAVSTDEAAAWCAARNPKELVEARLRHADGAASPAPLYALPDFLERLSGMPHPPRRLRLISPFDPLIRDRQRTAKVFGFDYTIEIFVPPKKRKYGYYVLPILEGERFTGRLDAKADRKKGRLNVLGLWWEDGVQPTPRRMAQLERELRALGEFVGAPEVALPDS